MKRLSNTLVIVVLAVALLPVVGSSVALLVSTGMVRAQGAEDFVIIAIPDTQYLAQSNPTTMYNELGWIASQDSAMIISLGDIVQTADSWSQWENADAAYDQLDAAGKAYTVGPGNHDDGSASYYSDWFGSDRFAGQPYYQGYYTGGNDNWNNYAFFTAGGLDFILINLQFEPDSGIIDWANDLLSAHSDRRGIVMQHNILEEDNSWDNDDNGTTYASLAGNPNLFLILCGHNHTSNDGSAYRLETRTGMDPVHILMTDYQDYSNTDYVRLLTFKPASNEIYAQVYSPYSPGGYRTSAANYEQFYMSYDMGGTSPTPTPSPTPPPSGSIDVRIATGDDDIEQNTEDGGMYSTSSDLELGDDLSYNGEQSLGLRFQNLVLPQGATITAAYIEFETDETDSETTSVVFRGQAADNAPAFGSGDFDLTNRSTTVASTAWEIPAWNTVSEKHQSPDLSGVVQELVNRGEWSPGNSMVFVVSGTGRRVAESYNGEPAAAPLLHVGYESGPPTGVSLSSFTAKQGGQSVLVEWRTVAEINMLGFNLYRGETELGPRSRLNDALIQSQVAPGSPAGAPYLFADDTVELGIQYLYWLQSVELSGHPVMHGPVSGGILTLTIDPSLWSPPDRPGAADSD